MPLCDGLGFLIKEDEIDNYFSNTEEQSQKEKDLKKITKDFLKKINKEFALLYCRSKQIEKEIAPDYFNHYLICFFIVILGNTLIKVTIPKTQRKLPFLILRFLIFFLFN